MSPPPEPLVDRPSTEAHQMARRHLRLGWGALAVFVALGLGLEALHAFKARLYLDVGNEERRLLWTLAHAHGTLLGLLHLGFAATVAQAAAGAALTRLASRSLLVATLLLPGGFFLGGFGGAGGDPGVGALLIPVGGLALLVGVCGTALALRRQ